MKVVQIVDSEAKSGTGAKGDWSMSLVELDNGKQVNIFNPIAEGDVVEAYDNKGFTNYRKVKGQPGGDDISKALRFIAGQNKAILDRLKDIEALVAKSQQKHPSQATDKVAEVSDNLLDGSEEIDLNDIPF